MLSLLRFTIAIIVAPLVTTLLITPPISYNGWYVGFFKIILTYTYIISIIAGLPTALILSVFNKCNYKTLAISGFVFGFTSHVMLLGFQPIFTITLNNIYSSISQPTWYGICSAVGACVFGLISGITSRSRATAQ